MADSNPGTPNAAHSTQPMVGQNVLPSIRIFGAVMFLAGLGMSAAGMYDQWITAKPSGEDWSLAMVIMGPIVLLMGGAALFFVWNITLHAATRRVTRRLGTLGMVKTTHYPFDTFTKVWLDRRMVENHPRFQVFLCGKLSGEKLEAFLFTQSDDQPIARAKAEATATYLGIPLEDTSGSPE